jgi:hypothetical protein
MNQPWLTTIDWPVNAFDPKEAKNNAVCATSSTVVNSPSTVSLSITFLMTSCSEIPSSCACSGICLSTRRSHETRTDDVSSHAVRRAFLGNDFGKAD